MTFWQRMSAAVGAHRVLRAMRYYPPYFGAHIRVMRADARDEQLARIRGDVEKNGKAHPRFEVTVLDEAGEAVARVGKLLSVRKRAGRSN